MGTIYELTLQLKTTRIILINNINNLFQQLARQSTPCRAQDKHIGSTRIQFPKDIVTVQRN